MVWYRMALHCCRIVPAAGMIQDGVVWYGGLSVVVCCVVSCRVVAILAFFPFHFSLCSVGRCRHVVPWIGLDLRPPAGNELQLRDDRVRPPQNAVQHEGAKVVRPGHRGRRGGAGQVRVGAGDSGGGGGDRTRHLLVNISALNFSVFSYVCRVWPCQPSTGSHR